MAYEYGYGKLEDQLIDLFRAGAPDFEAAEELLRQGADLNATGRRDDDNILSEILAGYWGRNKVTTSVRVAMVVAKTVATGANAILI